jgi:hypothetical protein
MRQDNFFFFFFSGVDEFTLGVVLAWRCTLYSLPISGFF